MKNTNNNMNNYNEYWKKISENSNWREFILPKRTTEQFFDEGKKQADILNKFNFFNEKSQILEFGCGIGRILKYINIPNDNKTGVDVCQDYLDKIEIDIIKVKSDGITIPNVLSESKDFIYSLMVFQHINKKDHTDLIKQLYTFLKKEGKMYIQFPNEINDYYTRSAFVNLYNKQEIIDYFKDLEFSNLEIHTGNLVGYGDGLVDSNTKHRELFALITK